jgi:hypothetical protein
MVQSTMVGPMDTPRVPQPVQVTYHGFCVDTRPNMGRRSKQDGRKPPTWLVTSLANKAGFVLAKLACLKR